MEIENNEMERLYAETFHGIQEGTILAGKVLAVKHDGIIVDIGYKSEGVVGISEFTKDELNSLNPGDPIEVYIEQIRDSEGIVKLSKEHASKIKSWEVIEKAAQDGALIEGTIIEKTKGGMTVDIGGVNAFLPGSQIDTKIVKDLDRLLGEKMTFKVMKINSKYSNIIVSRRAIIEEERVKQKVETIEKIKEGALLEGIVKNITDYGVFIDLGGLDGLLHISDISWGRINHPSEFFAIGDKIDVLVLKYDETTERVTLGYKQKQPDPWLNADEKYPMGQTLEGKVVNLTDYGAFIELEQGLEGLVHISEMEWLPKPKHPSKYLSVGEAVKAVVLKIDKGERKLSLSIKQTKPNPWEIIREQYKAGQKITGKVKSLTEFGAFIGLPDVPVDGLVHISDISWTKHIKHPSEVLKKGQKIDAVILAINPENERIALGLKQLEPDPWIETIPSTFKLGNEAMGRVLRITDFGIFTELEGGIEGLIYTSEIVQPDQDGTEIKEGDEILTRIIKIDLNERKIGLSMKNIRGLEQ